MQKLDIKQGKRPTPSDLQTVDPRSLPADMGANLKQLRRRQGLSLDHLAQLSGVSRAMLGQIETGKSVPTITLIWKVATALGVPLTALISEPFETRPVIRPKDDATLMSSSAGKFTLRPFVARHVESPARFFESRIAPGHRETAAAHPPGSRASLAVSAGALEIAVNTELRLRWLRGMAFSLLRMFRMSISILSS